MKTRINSAAMQRAKDQSKENQAFIDNLNAADKIAKKHPGNYLGSDMSGSPKPGGLGIGAMDWSPIPSPGRMKTKLPATKNIPTAIRHIIGARLWGLKSCYARALLTNPKLSVTLKISFFILINGRLVGVKVTPNKGVGVTECVRRRVQRWFLRAVPKKIRYGPITVRFIPDP